MSGGSATRGVKISHPASKMSMIKETDFDMVENILKVPIYKAGNRILKCKGGFCLAKLTFRELIFLKRFTYLFLSQNGAIIGQFHPRYSESKIGIFVFKSMFKE